MVCEGWKPQLQIVSHLDLADIELSIIEQILGVATWRAPSF